MHGNFLLLTVVLWPMLGAVLCYLIGRKNKTARNWAVFSVCAAEMVMAVILSVPVFKGRTPEFVWDHFCAMGLHFEMDGFRMVYLLVAVFMWFMSNGLFGMDYFSSHYRNRNRYYFFTLLTLGATAGVFLSANLYTTFIFFEIMSLTSYVWVAHDETKPAMKAAETYLAVAIIGGMATLMGLFMLHHEIGTLEISQLSAACAGIGDKSKLYWIAALISLGFAAKAGVFPLHIWLPKAHPVAPAPASALLSGMLTKCGIFGLIVVSANILRYDTMWGNVILIFGVLTMFIGALLAMFSVDLKRTLACSSMSQIGFILVGMGMASLLGDENGLAAHGALLHMVNHSLIKLVLFMAAGAVYMRLHKLDLNDIRGYGRHKPVLHFAFLMGYLGIIGMPLWNGFVSKSLIHESILEYIMVLKETGGSWIPYKATELLFLFTGGMTAAYMTKLYAALFWEKNEKEVQKQYDQMADVPLKGRIALLISGAVLPVMGVFSMTIMKKTAAFMQSFMASHGPHMDVNYFSSANLIGTVESLAVGAVLYAAVIRPLLMKKENGSRVYVDRWPKWLDLEDGIYRPVIEKFLPCVLGGICRVLDHLADAGQAVFNAVATFCVRVMDEGVDTMALGLWNTVLGKRRKPRPVPVGNRFTYALGSAFDWVVSLLNRTVLRHHLIHTKFTYVFAAGFEEWSTNFKKVTWSVSFGLLLLCLGLFIAFIYILW